MKGIYMIYLFLFMSATCLTGQTVIANQSFEGSGWSYSTNPAPYNTSGDIWDIVASPQGGLNATDGSNFWFMQDLDNSNGGGNFLHEITFSDQNISGFTSVTLSFDWEVFEFDAGDDVFYEVFEDGVGTGQVQIVNGSSNFSASGTETINISPSATSCYIVLRAEQNGGADYGFFDNVRLEGIASGPTVGWDTPSSTANETNSTQTIQIPVTLNNHTQNVDLDVAVTGGTAEVGDYTLNTSTLNFIGNGTQNVSIDINDDADLDDETIEITLTETTSTGITISPALHTITVLDDDMAPLPIAFINEFNYDNVGTDNSEYIEVAIEESFSGSLSDFEVVLYNGSGGDSYDTRTLDNFAQGNTTQGYIFYYFDFPSNGIQNGAPDGLALGYQGNLIEFISYEGTFTASGGIANGISSTDVGVSENNSAPDLSVQRIGSCSGDCPSGLTWTTGSLTKGTMNANAVLPVTWLTVDAQITNKSSVQIDWQTAEERNNDHFAVQHSVDGTDWMSIGKIEGKGNSTTTQSYSFIHQRALKGANFYRIQQVDIDGTMSYSPVRVVRILNAIEESNHTLAIYPNPTQDFIQFSGREIMELSRVQIFDQQGHMLKEWRNEIPQRLNIASLAAGVYFLRVIDKDQQLSTQRVLKIQ